MTDHGVPMQEQAPAPFWRRLCRQAALGAGGALGATAVAWLNTWLNTWLKGHRG